jgi:hypothetical protein
MGLILVVAPGAAVAQYISRSGSVVNDGGGGGSLSDISIIAGLIGAAWFAYLAISDSSDFWGVIGMAWMGLCAGVIVGTLIGLFF